MLRDSVVSPPAIDWRRAASCFSSLWNRRKAAAAARMNIPSMADRIMLLCDLLCCSAAALDSAMFWLVMGSIAPADVHGIDACDIAFDAR